MPPTALRLTTLMLALWSLFTSTATVYAAVSPDANPNAPRLQKRAQSYKGCYSSSADLTNAGSWTFQSTGYCGEKCTGQNLAVMGLTQGDECWCGGNIPADSDKVDDAKCNMPCTGYGQDNCGGDSFWSVYTTGTGTPGTERGSSSSSRTSSTKPSPPTTASPIMFTSIAAGQTIVVTVPAIPTATSTSSAETSGGGGGGGGGGGTNSTGIAVGVVVGVVAVTAIIAALIFWRKRKAAREAEEEYARKTQVGDFMRAGGERKAPGTGYSGVSDQRLDPDAGRRNSVGSLADNQDYSRRILRVANPDNS